MKTKTILLTATLVLTGAAALAQYSVNWFKIAGGGGTSSGGDYALSGTIGQADAGGPLTGGTYSLTGGFWAAATLIQEPGGPQLTMVTHGDGTLTVRWPSPSAGYLLQQSIDLTPTGWTDSTYPVSDDGTFRFVTFSPPSPRLFFRLRK
jgi:hypothetical protein